MYTLTSEQIDTISEKIKQAGINYSHLFEDLLDHICCDVEFYMQQKMEYNDACKKAFDKIGFNGLEKIQEATIFYVKLNLMIMKKTMNVLAIAGTGVITLGLLFRFQHWEGGSILYSLGFLVFLFGFFPVALLSVKKDLKTSLFSKKFLVYLIGFFCLFITGLAILCITMHWPGGKRLAVLSWILLLFVFFPIIFYQVAQSERNKGINLVLSIFAFFFVAISIVSTYNNHTNLLNTVDYYELSNEIDYYKSKVINLKPDLPNIANTKLVQVFETADELENLLEKYQGEILNNQESIYSMALSFMHKPAGKYDREEHFSSLKNMLKIYSSEAQSACNSPGLKTLIVQKFNTGHLDPDKFGHIYWEKRNFYGRSEYVFTLTSLRRMLRDVYQIQYELIKETDNTKAPE